MLAEGGFVAVGETGLDDVIPRADLDAQERVFRTQAGMAREAGLPLIVHVRGAFERLVRVLESIGPGGPGGILHAFGGSAEIAARLRPLGFLRGVAGSVTRPEAVKVRAAVARTPLDSLVLETDAPYIGTRRRSKFLPSAQAQAMGFHRKLSPEPKPTRDDPTRTVEPADVADIRDAVAMLHEVAPGEVEARTSAAAQCLFRLGPMPSRAEGTVPAPAPNRR
jgi:Tat protein secretion system quality control protein TatD with DNase activity